MTPPGITRACSFWPKRSAHGSRICINTRPPQQNLNEPDRALRASPGGLYSRHFSAWRGILKAVDGRRWTIVPTMPGLVEPPTPASLADHCLEREVDLLARYISAETEQPIGRNRGRVAFPDPILCRGVRCDHRGRSLGRDLDRWTAWRKRQVGSVASQLINATHPSNAATARTAHLA